MAVTKLFCAWVAAGALSTACAVAHAAPGSGGIVSGNDNGNGAGQPGPLSRAQVSAFALDDAGLPPVRADLNERVISIPADASGDVMLETTIYRPDGPGPFPLVVFNHGKIPGDPRTQARSDPVSFAREFVRRGYVVVAPNRRGFAGSGGTYEQDGCDVERNGLGQATDVAATIAYMSKQPYVDATHIAVAGASHGGLVTMAYGTDAAPGVRALINFSGGLRQDACAGWQTNLTDAFGAYGGKTRVPSLWLYGDNDSVWTPDLVQRMFAAFHAAQAGAGVAPGVARLVDFGLYKNDAHRLVGDHDGVRIWWPQVEAFLARTGMPTAVQYHVEEPDAPPRGTGFAAIDSVTSVPFVDDDGRAGYRKFLKQYPSRAFAVSSSGAWSWAEGGDDPMAMALANCSKAAGESCRLYAVNDTVVWSDGNATASTGTRPAAAPRDTASAGEDARPPLASR